MKVILMLNIVFSILLLQGCGGSSSDDIGESEAVIIIAPTSVVEGDSGTTNLIFTVTLSRANDGTTVDFATTDVTATTADNDYVASSGTLTFNNGSTSETITIVVNGDTNVENDEAMSVTLSNPSNGSVFEVSVAGGLISNDDSGSGGTATVSISAATITEGNSGVANMSFSVTLNSVNDGTTVDYATSDLTATTADNDYVGKTGTITFASGSTSETILVVVNGDTKVEQDEGFTVTLSNPTNGSQIGQASAVGVISNDDSVSDTTAPVITLNGSASVNVTQNTTYTELGATATDDVDGILTVPVPSVIVDTTTVGVYTLTYTVTDSSNNSASVIRTVNVIAANNQNVFSNLNDTGIAVGGNQPSGNNASCIGETVSEQDCSSGRDASSNSNSNSDGRLGFNFTKLDANGNALAASAVSWSCVKDNVTNLVWEVKNTTANSIHLNTNIYQWGGLTAQITNGATFGQRFSSWDSLVNGSNTEVLCGFSDWRVPNREELRSIVDYSTTNPAIDTGYFPNAAGTVTPSYWSSSPFYDASVNNTDQNASLSAWGIDFNGDDFNNSRSNSEHVRLVRSN